MEFRKGGIRGFSVGEEYGMEKTETTEIEKLLPKKYKWQCQGAKRGRKKGRAAEWKCGNFWN
jgi:hypothetical protein